MKKILFICLILGVSILSFGKGKSHDNGPAIICKINFK